MGSLGVLNVSGGDIVISFDTHDAAEAIRAKRMIRDMLRRGYALLIEADGKYTRCLDFKEDVGTYVVADFDPEIAAAADKEEMDGARAAESPANSNVAIVQPAEPEANAPRKRGRTKGSTREVKMEDAKARAVPRTSGG